MLELAPYAARLIRVYLGLRPWLARLRRTPRIEARLHIRLLNKRTQFSTAPPTSPALRDWAAAAVRRYRLKTMNEPGKLQ